MGDKAVEGMTASVDRPDLRLAELVAALSLGIDLGFGQPMEHVLRQCLIALRLAELAGLDDDDRAAVYYTALLVNVGCHTDAHEQAKWFGDDIALKADKYAYDQRSVQGVVATMRRLGSGNPPLHRVRTGLEFALGGFRDLDGMIHQHSRLARSLGEQLDLPVAALDGLGGSYERWDGKGWPGELAGDEIPITARIAQLAEYVEVALRTGGVDAARSLATKGAGTQFDPGLCELLCAHAEELLGGLDPTSTWDAVIEAEPALGVRMTPDQFDAALAAVATFVDLKSPYMLGHARAVSDLVADVGLEARPCRRRPAHAAARRRRARSRSSGGVELHLGQARPAGRRGTRACPDAAVPDRTHAPSVAGAGTPRRHRGAAPRAARRVWLPPWAVRRSRSSIPARILGAADAYQSMCEPRPHRAALSSDEAATQLRADVRAGRMDGDAVEAVLTTAGHRVRRRRDGPAGLTAREIDVLRLVARGLSHKEIAAQLVISPKTARNHIEHIYVKIGASNRTTASLFAMQHGLLPVDAPPTT